MADSMPTVDLSMMESVPIPMKMMANNFVPSTPVYRYLPLVAFHVYVHCDNNVTKGDYDICRYMEL